LNTAKFFSLVALYFGAVWAVLAYVPAISVTAPVPMTCQLWLWVAGGFLFGTYLGRAFVFMALGGRPLPYVSDEFPRLDMSVYEDCDGRASVLETKENVHEILTRLGKTMGKGIARYASSELAVTGM
jgi:hypothetical protein